MIDSHVNENWWITGKPYCKHESKKRLLTSTEWLPPSLAEDSEQQAAAYKNERMSRDQLPLTFNITFKTKIRGDFESMTLNIIGFWASRGFYQNEMYLVWGTTAKFYAAFLLCIPPAHQGRLAGDRKPSDSTIHCYLDCWKKKVVITIVCISNDNEVLAASLVHKTRFCENRLVFTCDHNKNLAFNFSRLGKELNSD